MALERSKRRDLLALSFITKSLQKEPGKWNRLLKYAKSLAKNKYVRYFICEIRGKMFYPNL